MRSNSRDIIAKNVKLVRLLLGLSQLNFALVVGISKSSIINIESGKNGYNLNLLDNIIKFTGFDLSQLSSSSFIAPENLRETLIKKYKNTDSNYYNILSRIPEIVYAVKYKLLKSDSLSQPKEISKIRQEILEAYGWDYKSSSLSNTLTRMKGLINVEPHMSKKNTNVYSKK